MGCPDIYHFKYNQRNIPDGTTGMSIIYTDIG